MGSGKEDAEIGNNDKVELGSRRWICLKQQQQHKKKRVE